MAKRATRKPAPTTTVEESKRQKFERIALARMNRALNSVRLIGNLASYNYDWTENDIAAMKAKLNEVIEQTFNRFSRSKRGEKPVFTFENAV